MNSTAEKIPDKFRCAIVVAKLTRPTNRGRSWRVDTREGNTLWIWPDKVHLLNAGQEYDVAGTVRDSYYNIASVRHLGPAPEDTPPPRPTFAIRRKTMDYYRPRDPAEQRQIWVCALLGREIELAGLMDKTALLERATLHAEVWNELFGPSEEAIDDQQQASHSHSTARE